MDIETTNQRCPSCLGNKLLKMISFRGISAGCKLERNLFDDLMVGVCGSCGMGYPTTSIDDSLLTKYYEKGWLQETGTAGVSKKPPVTMKLLTLLDTVMTRVIHFLHPKCRQIDLRRFSSQLAYVNNHLKCNNGPMKILEYGAGCALFSKLFRTHFSSSVEVDIIEPSKQWDTEYNDLKFNKIGFDASVLGECEYNLIHASHVFQHVPSFRDSFASISRALKPRGLLFIEVPNACDQYWQGRVFPSPPYLNFSTKKSLASIADANGLFVENITTIGPSVRVAKLESIVSNRKCKKYFCEQDYFNWQKKILTRRILSYFNPMSLLRGDAGMFYSDEGRSWIRAVLRKK